MSNLPVNANGRVSLHLCDTYTSTCVLDLDCYPDEVPNIVWCEIIRDFGIGIYDMYTTSVQDHMDCCHENQEHGFQFEAVYKNEEDFNYYWEDDHGRLVLSDDLPEIYYCWYKDTAQLAKCW